MLSNYRKKQIASKKNKVKKAVLCDADGLICTSITKNNVFISLTKLNGDVVFNITPVHLGYKNNQKLTPFAIKNTSRSAGIKSFDLGVRNVDLIVKGVNKNIEHIIRGLAEKINIKSIREVTGIPFNGTRAKSRRSR